MSNVQLSLLGASSTITPPGDSTASLHIEWPGGSWLVDCSGNVPDALREFDIDYRELNGIVFTHSHPDHTYGLPFLSHAFYSSHHSIDVMAPPETLPRLKDALEAYDLREPDRYLECSFEEISESEQHTLYSGPELQIRSFPNNHSRPGIGLKLSTNDQEFLFSGDTDLCGNIRKLGHGTDVLIHDCQTTHGYKRYFEGSHTSALELGKLASNLQINTLVPFHYNTTEFPPSWQDIAREIREYYRGTIVKPTRGMALHL
ncbi:MAG: MBL fold metallo-hydrolase [bacterium]